jgi:hypothetical protein
MASQRHYENTFASGTFRTSPEFPDRTTVVLYEAGNSLFLHFGPEGAAFEDLTMIPIGIDGAKDLLDAFHLALTQMGEISPKKSR